MRRAHAVAAFLFSMSLSPALLAQEADVELVDQASPDTERSQVATRSRSAIVEDQRAVTVVTREDIEERAPRTTPEALWALPGTSVQKTNHAGGSVYIRGLTGQHTLITFDGFRVNSSIVRSGPNQYLATINPLLLERIEVLRGSGSTLYGSDAIGGVIALYSRDPEAEIARVGTSLRGATNERSATGRAEIDADFGPVQVLAGLQGSRFGDLRGGTPLPGATVPVYDGDRQRFTSYDQVAGDAKAVVPLGDYGKLGRLTAMGTFLYQLDAPRTDKCSGPPLDCRFFEEQFYDLGYLRYDGDFRSVRDVSAGVALSRTHERRNRVRQEIDQSNIELDQVRAVQAFARASAPAWKIGDLAVFRLSYGADGYFDDLSSEAATRELSTGVQSLDVRGKYLDNSQYMSLAGYAFGELQVSKRFGFTSGVRLSGYRADVGLDPEAGTEGFDDGWLLPTFSVGARAGITDWLALVASFDQGFRAPNLDDLTARTSVGPGYQIGNPDLDPETSNSVELGAKVEHRWFRGHVFGYGINVDDFIGREMVACPAELIDECGGLTVFRLVNADSARIFGVESYGEGRFAFGPWTTAIFANLNWTRGTRDTAGEDDQPLSKIPPVSGRIGARVTTARVFLEMIGSYAFEQDRLSPADMSDPRIPEGGTDGYFMVNLRAGAQIGEQLRGSLTLWNLSNENYRVHGSGVDGAGFGLIAALSGTLGR